MNLNNEPQLAPQEEIDDKDKNPNKLSPTVENENARIGLNDDGEDAQYKELRAQRESSRQARPLTPEELEVDKSLPHIFNYIKNTVGYKRDFTPQEEQLIRNKYIRYKNLPSADTMSKEERQELILTKVIEDLDALKKPDITKPLETAKEKIETDMPEYNIESTIISVGIVNPEQVATIKKTVKNSLDSYYKKNGYYPSDVEKIKAKILAFTKKYKENIEKNVPLDKAA